MGNIKSKKFIIDYCILYDQQKVKKLLNYKKNNSIDDSMKLFIIELIKVSSRTGRIDVLRYLLKKCDICKYNVIDDSIILSNITFISLICTGIRYTKRLKYIEILTELLNYRCKIHIPFDIKKHEEYIYNITYDFRTKDLYKILFEYGEKINYKLDISKIKYCYCDEYLKKLITHNYFCYKKNHVYLSTTICNNKSIGKTFGRFSFYKYIKNNNIIYKLDFCYKPVHCIDYIFCISY